MEQKETDFGKASIYELAIRVLCYKPWKVDRRALGVKGQR
jgi:hypothetical protein